MKIACLADLHGHLPEEIPECDVLVIAGDICPATNHSYEFQLDWLETTFDEWVGRVVPDAVEIVAVAGNHDWCFETGAEARYLFSERHVAYLQDDEVTFWGHKFYGHPWTPNFCGWAFNSGSEALQRHHARIHRDTDVLVTHGPPMQILDVPGGQTRHCGCKYLRSELYSVKPKLHVFGHIHGSYGKTVIDGTTYVNASYVDESYSPRGPESIQVIEL